MPRTSRAETWLLKEYRKLTPEGKGFGSYLPLGRNREMIGRSQKMEENAKDRSATAMDRYLRRMRLNERKLAVFLSFIYCGLGQIYKDEMSKGVCFIISYTLLVVSFLFSFLHLHLIYLPVLSASILMLCIGIIDAYMDSKPTILTKRWLLQQRLLDILDYTGIAAAVIVLLMFWMHDFSVPDSDSVADVQDTVAQDIVIDEHSLEPAIAEPGTKLKVRYVINTSKSMALRLACSIQRVGTGGWIELHSNDAVVNVTPGVDNYSAEFVLPRRLSPGEYHVGWGIWNSDFTIAYDFRVSNNALTVLRSSTDEGESGSEHFSIQVAAFRDLGEAKKLHERLQDKGYTAAIENPPTGGRWYRVLVGEFRAREDAISFAEELHEQERLSYVIVRSGPR